jgi:hypothetical protein
MFAESSKEGGEGERGEGEERSTGRQGGSVVIVGPR